MGQQSCPCGDWLKREDRLTREDRLARLKWLMGRMPQAEYVGFPGGWMSKSLFDEAGCCFVCGQFLGTIVLGLGYIERTLAAMFYGLGRNDLERVSISLLLGEAVDGGWISQREFANLERARKVRNAVTHFRRLGDCDGIEYRAVEQNEAPYGIMESDARQVMESAIHLLARHRA